MRHTVCKSYLCQYFGGSFDPFMFAKSGVNHWQSHIVQCSCSWKKIECLKNKTDFLIADFSQLIVFHFTHIFSVEDISSGSRGVQTSQEVHQSRFTGTGS